MMELLLTISLVGVSNVFANDINDQLLQAAQSGNQIAVFSYLNENSIDVNARSVDSTTALHWAVYHNNEKLVKALIKAKADVSVKNDYGATPMAEAAEHGNATIIKMLIQAGADIESPNELGQTTLMTVARSNHIEAAKVLITNGANINARERWRGQTALMWACAQRQPEMVKLLIKMGADVNAQSNVEQWERKVTAEPRPQNRPDGGLTALLFASREGCALCIKELIKGGADINVSEPNRITPLLMAVLNGHFDAAKVLVDAGADVNRWDMWGRAPLYAAVDFKTIPSGGRPDRPSLDNTTPLELIELLLAKGANPNMQLKLFPPYRSLGADRGGDNMLTVGTTPLIRAAKAGDVESARVLLTHGALPNLRNSLGYTPLLAAAGLGSNTRDTRARLLVEKNNLAVAKVLIAAGADINVTDEGGRTPLHGAVERDWNAFVEFLVGSGADTDIKDKQGKTALQSFNVKTEANGETSAEANSETNTETRNL